MVTIDFANTKRQLQGVTELRTVVFHGSSVGLVFLVLPALQPLIIPDKKEAKSESENGSEKHKRSADGLAFDIPRPF